MTREEKIGEINLILHQYPTNKNSRLSRLWNKRCKLSNKKLNNLVKRFKLHKLICIAE